VEIHDIASYQKLLYKLLKSFHEICEEYGLVYNLFGGSLLGAVRNEGIIPWDDDIDVTMPRPDYEQFIKIVNSFSEEFVVFNPPMKNYIYPYAKFCFKDTVLIENVRKKYSVLKLYIDVFPVDGYPNKDDEKNHFEIIRRCNKGRLRCVSKLNCKGILFPLKYIKCLFYRFVGYRQYIKKEIETAKKYSYQDCEYVSCNGAGWNERGKLLKTTYLNRKLYKFGDLSCWGIVDYDEQLTNFYGDYMTPPPVEKRVNVHNYKLYVDKKYLGEIK
jgi:lipopolysaccharide cholinephosphotransferase